ncbi:MAG: hypothetical protein SNH73_06255 [Rikenellaceae bacterium]
MTTNTSSIFGLTAKQTQLLFSLQRLIIKADCSIARDAKLPALTTHGSYDLKARWLAEWDVSINNYLNSIEPKLVTKRSEEEIKALIAEIDASSETTIWKYMVLFECALYAPYYPLSKDKEEIKRYKNVSLNKRGNDDSLDSICALLSIDSKYVKIFQKSYRKSIKSISGYWQKVAISVGIGIAVVITAIVTFQYEILSYFAVSGVSGAAAISSGLAALGGGAIAVGGAGMAGGIAVLVGGGTLLGASAGLATGLNIANLGSDVVMIEAAKLQTILKEIILAIQKDTKNFQSIIMNIVEQNNKLRDELAKLKFNAEANKKKIKDLEKTISYLEKIINVKYK